MPLEKMARTAEISRRYLFQELESSYMTLTLIICFFISGLVDSVAFNSWNCFVNMQSGKSASNSHPCLKPSLLRSLHPSPLNTNTTPLISGNTIFAALGLSGQPQASHSQQYYKSLTSIAAFCLGSTFFSLLHRLPLVLSTPLTNTPPRLHRLTLLTSFLLQSSLLIVAASLVSTNSVSNQPFVAGVFSSGSTKIPASKVHFLDLCPIALISFQAAGQVTLSRVLGVMELPTVVVSALYHDACADIWQLRESWRKAGGNVWVFLNVQERRQQKRGACIVALFLGGVVGAMMYKSSPGMGGALWLAAGLKGAVFVGWGVWRGRDDGRGGVGEA